MDEQDYQQMKKLNIDILRYANVPDIFEAYEILTTNPNNYYPRKLLTTVLDKMGFTVEILYYVHTDGKVLCSAMLMRSGLIPLFHVPSATESDYRLATHRTMLNTILKLSVVLKSLYCVLPLTKKLFRVDELNMGENVNTDAVDLIHLFGEHVLKPFQTGIAPIISMPQEFIGAMLLPSPLQAPFGLDPELPFTESEYEEPDLPDGPYEYTAADLLAIKQSIKIPSLQADQILINQNREHILYFYTKNVKTIFEIMPNYSRPL